MAILDNKGAVSEVKSGETAKVNKIVADKNKLLVFVLGFILVLTIAAVFYLSFQKSAISSKQADFDTQLVNLQKEVDDLNRNKVEASQIANETLKEIEKNELRWSTIISAVQDLVPYESATKKPKINFLSYSGSSDGKLALSAVTNPSSLPPFKDVSELISVFNNSNFFKDAYVPSISQGTSESGATTLSFVFNVTYQEPSLENVDEFKVDDQTSSIMSPVKPNDDPNKVQRLPTK